jgi:opacity protein-like surface antigen
LNALALLILDKKPLFFIKTKLYKRGFLMKRLALLGLILSTLSTPSTLNADMLCCEPPECETYCNSLFEGFYVGVAGGLATNHSHTKTTSSADYVIQESGFLPSLTLGSSDDLYDKGGFGEVFLGYGNVTGNIYYGGRFGVNFSESSPEGSVYARNDIPFSGDHIQSSFLKNDIKSEFRHVEYTFDFKFGVIFCQTSMLYGVVGAAFNKHELEGTSVFDYDNGFTVGVTTISDGFSQINATRKENTTGLRLGMGLEHFISPYVSIQAAYVYTQYDTLSKSKEDDYGVDVTVLNVTTVEQHSHSASFKTDDHKHFISLGLAFYF